MSEAVKLALIQAVLPTVLPALATILSGVLIYIATLRNRKDIAALKVEVNGSLQKWLESEKQRSYEEGHQAGFQAGWRQAGC